MSATTTNQPTATYRFQLHKDFGFDDVQQHIAYLKELGISHVYLSPITTAVEGSQHGYNVTDYNVINPELGGEERFRSLAAALKAEGIGIVVDFVPNHMGIEGGQNAWWQDILRNGQASKYANFFDINWDRHGDGKVVMPFLGDDIEQLIGNDACVRHATTGEWVAPEDRDNSEVPEFAIFFVRDGEYCFDYWGTAFPINDAGQALIQANGADLDTINQSPALLAEILDIQHYRPIDWKQGIEQLNHRRFFSINELAGVRIEDPEVFDAVHAGLKRWSDVIDGVRLDHIDGLADPEAYLERLRETLGEQTYIVAEKILAPHERLPEYWPIQGTSGYDAMIPMGQVLTRPSDALAQAYATFIETGEAPDYETVLHQSRLDMMEGELKPELDRLEGMLASIAQAPIEPMLLREGLKEFAAAMEVYRTYITADGIVSEQDKDVIKKTVQKAQAVVGNSPVADVIELVGNVFLDGTSPEFTQRFQQFTGPVIAKGTEDTAFYRYHMLRGAAEVGAELEHLGMTPADFVELMQGRMATTMNAMSTHDTKLGEDTRTRAASLSHIPEIWAEKSQQWKEGNAGHAKQTARYSDEKQQDVSITLNDQYLFYQTLVATAPLDFLYETGHEVASEEWTNRMKAFMEKAIREAKLETAWVPALTDTLPGQDPAYEAAVSAFVDQTMRDPEFMQDVKAFAQRVAVMGANVSLQQRVLQTTMPGVPDIYQGSESWNLSTVDPDNRRTPDYDALLTQLTTASNKGLDQLSAEWPNGAIKQVLTQTLLDVRKANPELFNSNEVGELTQVTVYNADGTATDDLAYARVHEGKAMLIVIPRELNDAVFHQEGIALGLQDRAAGRHIKTEDLPAELQQGTLVDVLRNTDIEQGTPDRLDIDAMLQNLPAAVVGTGLER